MKLKIGPWLLPSLLLFHSFSLPLSSTPSQFPTSSPAPLLPGCRKVSSFSPLLQVGLQPTESSNCGLKLQNKFFPFKAVGLGLWQEKAGYQNYSFIAFCACFLLLLLLNSIIYSHVYACMSMWGCAHMNTGTHKCQMCQVTQIWSYRKW